MTEKQYKTTHPWINFSLDLRRASHRLWMLLGEAQSKCRHISGVPLRPEEARKLHQIYLTKGVRATTAIEGNTLSEQEVQAIIERNEKVSPSREYLKQEVVNIVEACNSIARKIGSNGPEDDDIAPEEVMAYNGQVLKALPGTDDGSSPGKIRTFPVVAGSYRGAPAEDCGYLLERFCEWMNDPAAFDLGERNRMASGILKSILAHVYLVWIHPFQDGNGRTARLLEFRFLLEAGAPSPAGQLLSNHYNETREEYYRYLELSWRKQDGVLDFLEYALQGFVDQLEEQIVMIRLDQIEVAWENYIHTQFSDSSTEKRRKNLLLTISKETGTVPKNRILALDTDLAKFYMERTLKTFSRDLGDLEKKGLLKSDKDTVSANKERIIAFLPILKPEILPELLDQSARKRKTGNLKG
ncbi:MAG TPA: Fic family protein [Thermovirgaceae bacterium]|nr:Fic family protein [Thermovirgaceae bacterium]